MNLYCFFFPDFIKPIIKFMPQKLFEFLISETWPIGSKSGELEGKSLLFLVVSICDACALEATCC